MLSKAIHRIFQYLDAKSIPHTRFEKESGLSNGYLKTMLKREADLGESAIKKIVDYCLDMDISWLMTGRGEMIARKPALNPPDAVKVINEPLALQLSGNDDEMQPVPLIDIKVAAGDGYLNPDYVSNLEYISVPKRMLKKNQLYFWVRNRGESMAPGIQDSALILIRLLDRSEWSNLAKELVCVVVSDGKAYLKRVKNRLNKGFIVCMSDNPDKTQFPDFTLEEPEVHTLWYAEAKLEFKFPNIHSSYYSRLQHLEDNFLEMKHALQLRGIKA